MPTIAGVLIALAMIAVAAMVFIDVRKDEKNQPKPVFAYQGSTEGLLPELAAYGPCCRCAHIHRGTVNGMTYEYYDWVRVAATEKDLEYGGIASGITWNLDVDVIKVTGFPVTTSFLWNSTAQVDYLSKTPLGYEKAGRYKAHAVYAPNGKLAWGTMDEVDKVYRWWNDGSTVNPQKVNDSLRLYFGPRYLVSASLDTVEILTEAGEGYTHKPLQSKKPWEYRRDAVENALRKL